MLSVDSIKSWKHFDINKVPCLSQCCNGRLASNSVWHTALENWNNRKLALHLHIFSVNAFPELETSEYCAYLQGPWSESFHFYDIRRV